MSFLSWCMRACEQLPQEGAEFLALCLWRSWLAPPCGQETSECDTSHSVSDGEMTGVPLSSSVVTF